MQKRLPLSAGTVLQNRYRIVRQLGHGGMGAVYEAVDDEIGLAFALKETFADDDAMRQAFKREARMLASVTHEAFPRVTHYFTGNDGCFLVMELIRGDDLQALLTKRGEPFEQEQILKWADQILDALEDLHAQGIVHRDIKPSNLKLNTKGKIKLLDFGIAKGNTGETTAITTVGSLAAATLQYAPLEQVLRASPDWFDALSFSFPEKTAEILRMGTDARSDLYALGATLYQLLTKKLPVNAPTRALVVWAGKPDKLTPAHEINNQVSPEISSILQKAMEIDCRSRLASASEMREMLRETGNEKTKIIQPTASPPIIAKNSQQQSVFTTPKADAVEQEANRSGNKILVNFDAAPPAYVETVSVDVLQKRQKSSLKPVWLIVPIVVLLLIGAFGRWQLKSSEDTSKSELKIEKTDEKQSPETQIPKPGISPITQPSQQPSRTGTTEVGNTAVVQKQSTPISKPTEIPTPEAKPTIAPQTKPEQQRPTQISTANRQPTAPRQTQKSEPKQKRKTKKSGDCIFTDDCR
jgi:serine/threonine protein kinase